MRTVEALVIFGLLQAGVLILLASGLVSVFSVLRVPNFAQVGIYLVGGYLSYVLFTAWHLPAVLGMLAAAPAGGLLGIALWYAAFRPLLARPRAEMFVTAFGAFVVIENLLLSHFGPSPVSYPVLYGSAGTLWGLVPVDRLLLGVVALAVIVALAWFYTRTLLGKAVMAVSQNKDAAERSGIDAERISLLTLFMGGALGGLGGALYGGIAGMTPASGSDTLIAVFAILIVGGMGSLRGAVIAGLTLSVLSSVVTYYQSGNAEVVYFLVVIVILLLRPEGLFGWREMGSLDAD